MASNPEFLREGSSIEDFMRPDRVVIGVDSEPAEELMREIYRPLFLSDTPIVKTGIETAELVKYASNSFLAVKISFINEIAKLAEAVGADVFDVAKAMGLDKRIGSKFLHPGLGFGGSCLPKDTNAIVHIAQEAGSDMSIVRSAIEVNRDIPGPGPGQGRAAGRRPDRQDRRPAGPGLQAQHRRHPVGGQPRTGQAAEGKGCTVRAHDPAAMDNFKTVHPDLVYCQIPLRGLRGRRPGHPGHRMEPVPPARFQLAERRHGRKSFPRLPKRV